MKKVTPRITSQNELFLLINFKTINQGCEHILNSFPTLFTATINRIKKTKPFNPDQLIQLINYFKPKSPLEKKVNFGAVYVPPVTFHHKLLPLFDIFCLDIWAQAFWYEEERSIEDYVKTLL